LATDLRFCGAPARDANGQIVRSQSVLRQFEREHPKPQDGKVWITDHVIPLACGGCDAVANLQWLPEAQWREVEVGAQGVRRERHIGGVPVTGGNLPAKLTPEVVRRSTRLPSSDALRDGLVACRSASGLAFGRCTGKGAVPLNRWLRSGAPEVDITQADMDTAYQLGFQNGRACGELNGRTQVVQELEIILASRGRVLADVQADEVDLAKMRTVH
jgi:hypothetical protein